MKIYFIFIVTLTFMINPVLADDILGSGRSFVKVKKTEDSTEIYVKNYQNQDLLLYTAHFVYSDSEGLDANQEGDILLVNFFCEEKKTCWRFFNRRTNQLSEVYFGNDMLEYDSKKDMLIVYERTKNLITIKRVFKLCKKPLQYQLEVETDSGFNVIYPEFKFSGDLKLDYVDVVDGRDAILIIPINYQKFLENCK